MNADIINADVMNADVINADSSPIHGVDHLTLRCSPEQLWPVQHFYETVVGLKAGARPAFDFPGAWLYAGDDPILHLAAVLDKPVVVAPTPASSRPAASEATGCIDHFALRVKTPVSVFRERLTTRSVPFSEAPVPGFPLHQIFLIDPLGVKVELNFVIAR